MSYAKPLEVVFLTNFSDSCFRAIPSVAQLTDDLAVNLTIVHTYNPDDKRRSEAESSLRSFFPEADRYTNTTRLALSGDPEQAVRQILRRQSVDLVVCPASDPLGLPRLGHRSLRSRLVHGCGVPIWTIGRGVKLTNLGRPVRNVACWMDGDTSDLLQLALAEEYATKLGARLHLLCALPEIHEGLLARFDPDRPLHPTTMRKALDRLTRELPQKPEFHIGTGRDASVRIRLTEACEADILFTPLAKPLPFSSGFSALDRCSCPAVCIGEGSTLRRWNLLHGRAFPEYAAKIA